jgi:hypothetical protein
MTRMALSLLMLAVLVPGTVAFAQLKPEPVEDVELEPLVVEGKRDPLDVIGVHRDQLPCVGPCEDAAQPETGFQRFLRGLAELSIYGPPEQKPEPVQSLGVVNPIKARLDDKQP